MDGEKSHMVGGKIPNGREKSRLVRGKDLMWQGKYIMWQEKDPIWQIGRSLKVGGNPSQQGGKSHLVGRKIPYGRKKERKQWGELKMHEEKKDLDRL